MASSRISLHGLSKLGLVGLLLHLIACPLSGDDYVEMVSFQPDGSEVVSIVLSNASYVEDKKKLSPRAFSKKISEHCAEMRKNALEEKRVGFRLLGCGEKPAPHLFGDFAPPSRAKPNTKDLHLSFVYEGQPPIDESKIKQYIHNRNYIKLDILRSAGIEIGKSCSFLFQTPWPIVSTNADMVFHRYNLAAWNCKGDKEIRVKLESRRP